ncbi:MAG: hypothetical protein Q9160_009083 [Pyrenula sp. 1 TL-2023]
MTRTSQTLTEAHIAIWTRFLMAGDNVFTFIMECIPAGRLMDFFSTSRKPKMSDIGRPTASRSNQDKKKKVMHVRLKLHVTIREERNRAVKVKKPGFQLEFGTRSEMHE